MAWLQSHRPSTPLIQLLLRCERRTSSNLSTLVSTSRFLPSEGRKQITTLGVGFLGSFLGRNLAVHPAPPPAPRRRVARLRTHGTSWSWLALVRTHAQLVPGPAGARFESGPPTSHLGSAGDGRALRFSDTAPAFDNSLYHIYIYTAYGIHGEAGNRTHQYALCDREWYPVNYTASFLHTRDQCTENLMRRPGGALSRP